MGDSARASAVKRACFGIVGGGWRAEFYLRVARELPARFRVGGMLVRNETKGQAIEYAWGVATYRTLDQLLAAGELDFVVVSVPWPVTPVMLRELADRGMPALSETPPAPDLEGLIALHQLTDRGARIQVAEQYQFQPLHAARIQLVRSDKLGTISQAQVSAAHGYHGMSLVRKLLGVRFEEATIWAREFTSPIVSGPGRAGPPEREARKALRHWSAFTRFGYDLFVARRFGGLWRERRPFRCPPSPASVLENSTACVCDEKRRRVDPIRFAGWRRPASSTRQPRVHLPVGARTDAF